jgi:D-methionine transport system substrate-binding protein
VLSDVDAAAINTNYALESGLNPVSDSIYIEQDSPYVNVIAVRAEDRERPEVRKLVGVYQSAEIRKFIAERFQGAVVPGW